MKAKWEHDCDKCSYLGSTTLDKGIADWYECNDSVIARFGDEGPHYWSMPKVMVNDDRYVTDAYPEMTALARFMLTLKKT